MPSQVHIYICLDGGGSAQTKNNETERTRGLDTKTREETAKVNQMTALKFQMQNKYNKTKHYTFNTQLQFYINNKVRKQMMQKMDEIRKEGNK